MCFFFFEHHTTFDSLDSKYSLLIKVAHMTMHFLTGGFIIVDIDPVQLEITVTMVTASWVNTMLITDHFPELLGKYNK